MHHILFGSNHNNLKTAILIKEAALKKPGIYTYYINPLVAKGIGINSIVAVSLKYQANNKCTAANAKDYISGLLPAVDKLGITTLLCADGTYFKYLTKNTKITPFHGQIVPCAIDGYEHISIILSINYQAIDYDPNIQPKLEMSVSTLAAYLGGTHSVIGSDIIHYEEYLKTAEGIKEVLNALHQYPELVCDIESKSLDFWNCGIATISFAWSKHRGIAFAVDRADCNQVAKIRKLLKTFLVTYKGKLTYHNISFDAKVLVFNLWMKHLQDYEGMLDGIFALTKNFDDTKLIAYLATNNTVKNELGLKALGQEYSGNYAEDMTGGSDAVPIDRLLKYNLLDCLTTWFVKEKYEPIMDQDLQRDLYENLFKPSVKTLLQTELCGIPIEPIKVQEAKTQLSAIVNEHLDYFKNDPVIKDFHYGQMEEMCRQKTLAAKKKVYEMDDPIIKRFTFNPGSDIQLQKLIYTYLGYTVIDLTKNKQPATGKEALQKLRANAKTKEHEELFDHLIGLSSANKILTSFIPAFEKAQQLPDGSWRLYGNFNLGGTISLRLSSSKPNLMQLPSGSVFAKIIKACFVTPKGWFQFTSDFDALEDKINTLQTRDPNKMKIYTEGYCGHCYRSLYYWPDKMPDIRQASKQEDCFRIKKGSDYIYCKKGDLVTSTINGTEVTLAVEDLYAKVRP